MLSDLPLSQLRSMFATGENALRLGEPLSAHLQASACLGHSEQSCTIFVWWQRPNRRGFPKRLPPRPLDLFNVMDLGKRIHGEMSPSIFEPFGMAWSMTLACIVGLCIPKKLAPNSHRRFQSLWLLLSYNPHIGLLDEPSGTPLGIPL